MTEKILKCKNEYFYDESGIRVTIRENVEISIKANSGSFIVHSTVGSLQELNICNSEDKLQKLTSDNTIINFKRIKQKGEFLYFCISNKQSTNRIKHHEFEVELLEDLYVYLKSDWKVKEPKLYSCACAVKKVITESIDCFQEVYAESLNEVYKNTFVHYCRNEGNPACNAIDKFYDTKGHYNSTLRQYREIK